MASLDRWGDYAKVKGAIFVHSDTADAPWTVIKSNCEKRMPQCHAPCAVRATVEQQGYAAQGNLDPFIVGCTNVVCERAEHQEVPIL